jgi:YjjG family noncanonical pyrimidine nucleotidase
MKRYSTLLFDADDTLFDYNRAEADALQITFAQHGIAWQPDFLATYRQINREMWQQLEQGRLTPQTINHQRFVRLLQTLQLDPPSETFATGYLANIAACAALLEGALDVVTTLAPHYRLAILTNGLQAVQYSRLARSPLAAYIPPSHLIISEEVGAAKPDPAIFAIALERLGSPPKDEVLMIGDSLSSDIRGAANAGLDSCWYNPAAALRPADLPITHEIRHLCDIVPILIHSPNR